MEKLPIYLILLIVYLVAASGGSKKKKRQQEKTASAAATRRQAGRKRTRSEQEERARRARTAQTEKGFAAAFAPERAAQATVAASGTASGAVSGHEEKADRLAGIPEGEDLCHPERGEKTTAGTQWLDTDRMRTAENAPEQERSLPGEDVLRGIIMSEILTRPCERRARNRRGYHG